MKVHELAKELNVDNKELIQIAQDQGLEIKSHMNGLSDEQIDIIKSALSNEPVNNQLQENDSVEESAEKNDENEAKDETKRENEELKQQLVEMKKMMEQMQQHQSEEDEEDAEFPQGILNLDQITEEIPEISMNKTIKVMSLTPGGLNLKTSKDDNAQKFRFEFVGQVVPIIYSDLVKVINLQRKFFEQGYCMILDKDVIKAHYLEEAYKSFVDGNIIKNILTYSPKKIRTILANTTSTIQKSIVDLVIDKINSDENVDKNKVSVISDEFGEDLFEIARRRE